MKAAELFVTCLENEHVEFMFGVPGEENVDIISALLDSPIKFITTRHEQSSAGNSKNSSRPLKVFD